MLVAAWSWVAIWRRALLVLLAIAGTPAQLLAATELPDPGDDRLAELHALDLDAAFAAVAAGIRFEPYAGILRGPAATALARGGNADDQALLLADILKGKGYRVRFAQGTLSGENLATLIRGMYPPSLPQMSTPPAYGPFDPTQDKALLAIAANHVWLEVDQGDGTWLPMDPSFPRARIGEAYATATARFDTLPETGYQQLVGILQEETADGKTRVLGRFEGPVAEFGLRPLSLLILGTPLVKAPDKPAKAGAGDMFNAALSGEQPEQPTTEEAGEPAAAGVRYGASLRRGAESISMGGSVVLDANPDSEIRRQWLRLEIGLPGAAPRVVERDLYVADAPGIDGARPVLYRRYAIAVLAGPIDPSVVAAYLVQARNTVDVAAMQQQVEALAGTGSSDVGTLREITALDDEIGTLTGHWLGLSLGSEIGALTRRLALNNGVTYAQAVPRIVIVSLEGEPGTEATYRTAIDLRLDEVEAWPYPGHAARASEHFQTARGLQDSMLEGRFLERVLGVSDAASTMNLIARVEGGQAALLSFGPGQADQLDRIEDLSPYARRLIEQSLKGGREVIVPPRPVQLAGRDRLGWWERDPLTGRMIGVMDDGLHQAMTEYSVNTEKIGLDDQTGMVIGAIVGSTTTQILIANKVLEYGEMTAEMASDIMKQIKQLKCMSCPEAKAKVKAAASGGEDDDCFIIKKDEGLEAKPISFCEQYTRGMTCAASDILSGYTESGSVGFQAELKIDLQMPCDD